MTRVPTEYELAITLKKALRLEVYRPCSFTDVGSRHKADIAKRVADVCF
jgi:hypothetical protein